METRNWTEYFTDDNHIPYYYNTKTKKTQWERPEEVEYYYYGRHDRTISFY